MRMRICLLLLVSDDKFNCGYTFGFLKGVVRGGEADFGCESRNGGHDELVDCGR